MIQKLYYAVVKTAVGWVGILGSTTGLKRITLPQHSEAEAQQQIGDSNDLTIIPSRIYEDLKERLVRYFNGHKVDFPDRLDLSATTAFQCDVWEITRLIPYGETRSYRWVAEQIGKPKAMRAVGQALGRNPLPVIVPCHRVLASNGGLGGFSGGLEMKRFLLSLESRSGAR